MPGKGGLPYGTDGDARRLAWFLVSLRVFRAKRQYFKPPRSRLGFREETQNYAYHITSVVINQRFLACLAFDDIVNSYSSFNIN